MIALALFLLAGSVVGWKMHQAVAKKRFESDLARLESRLSVCQRLAVTTQADWKGILKKEKEGWTFEAICIDDPRAKKLKPLHLHSFTLTFNSRKTEEAEFDFFSTGKTLPEGTFQFIQNDLSSPVKKEWNLPAIFHAETSKDSKKPPLHPDELN